MSDVELDVSRVFDLESGCVEECIDCGGDGRVLDVRVVNPRNLRVAGVSDEGAGPGNGASAIKNCLKNVLSSLSAQKSKNNAKLAQP